MVGKSWSLETGFKNWMTLLINLNLWNHSCKLTLSIWQRNKKTVKIWESKLKAIQMKLILKKRKSPPEVSMSKKKRLKLKWFNMMLKKIWWKHFRHLRWLRKGLLVLISRNWQKLKLIRNHQRVLIPFVMLLWLFWVRNQVGHLWKKSWQNLISYRNYKT